MLRENDHLADVVADDVFIAFSCKIFGKARHGNVLDNIVPVHPPDGGRDRIAVKVGCKYFDVAADIQFLHRLGKKNGDRICLLPGRTARHPDAQLLFLRSAFEQLLDHRLF